jgi:hypothetical protein
LVSRYSGGLRMQCSGTLSVRVQDLQNGPLRLLSSPSCKQSRDGSCPYGLSDGPS